MTPILFKKWIGFENLHVSLSHVTTIFIVLVFDQCYNERQFTLET